MGDVPQKKARYSREVFSEYFTEEDNTYDRVLLADNTKFFVKSAKLIQCSDYFRAMLTSDFIEKRQETIEFKDIKAEKMKMFLDVIFKPKDVEVTEDNLHKLTELFVYFQATNTLVDFLKKAKVNEIFPAEKLFDIADVFGISEMKEFVEESLIVELRKVYSRKARLPKYRQPAKAFEFEETVLSGLKLVDKYRLLKLQAAIDAQLSIDYADSPHHISVEGKYILLLSNYSLTKLTKVVDDYAAGIFHSDGECVLRRYLTSEPKVEMDKLKVCSRITETVVGPYIHRNQSEQSLKYGITDYLANRAIGQDYYIKEFEKEQKDESLHIMGSYLHTATTYGFTQLKEIIREYIEEYLKKEKHDEQSVITGKKYNKLALVYDLEPMKGQQQSDMIAEFNLDKNNYAKFTERIKRYKLLQLKDAIEEYLITKFNESEKEDAFIDECCKYSKELLMEKLKDSLETYFLAEFNSDHSCKNIKYAFECNMQQFMDVITDFLSNANYDDADLKAAREHILSLPSEHHTFILQTILRKPDEPYYIGIFQ